MTGVRTERYRLQKTYTHCLPGALQPGSKIRTQGITLARVEELERDVLESDRALGVRVGGLEVAPLAEERVRLR
jgi:hypothetical protein